MPRAEDPLLPVVGRLAALAEASPGREVCGLVVGAGAGDGEAEAWPLPNAAPDPATAFLVDPGDLLAALRRLDGEGRALLAVFHSHLQGGPGLSARDLAAALVDGEPLLSGVAQVVVSLRAGRVETIRAHRWAEGGYRGVDLWTSVR